MYLFNFNIILLLILTIPVHSQSPVQFFTDSIRHYEGESDSTVLSWVREAEKIIGTKDKIDSPAVYDFYKSLGAFHFSIRNYTSCAEAYQFAIAYQPGQMTKEQKFAHCDIFNQLGISYTLSNQKRKGIDYFKKCIQCDLNVKGKATYSVLRKYRNLARASILSGEYAEAVNTCNKVLPLLKRLDPTNKKQAFRTNILAARAILHLPTPERAQKYLESAAKIMGNYPGSFSESDKVYLYKAMLRSYHISRDTPSVQQTFIKYTRANKKRLVHTNDISVLIDYHFMSALYLYRYFDLQKAKLHIDTLMALQCRKGKNDKVIVSAIRKPADIITHLQVKIRINFSLWNKTNDTSYLIESIKAAHLGFEILDYYRRTLNDPISRLEYVEYEYELFDDCFEPFYEAYRQKLITADDFWKIAEKARGIHISEQANLRSLEDSYLGVDTLLVAEEHRLMDSIYVLSKQMDDKDEGITLEISSHITNLQLKLYQLQDRMAELHPQYQQKRTARQIPTIADIQNKLASNQVLIEYVLANSLLDESSLLFTFIIEKKQASVIRNEVNGLPELIKNYFHLISKPPLSYQDKSKMISGFKRLDSLGETLRATLLPDMLLDDHNHLLVIPHKELFFLPFSALPTHELEVNGINDWNDYEFLSEYYSIQLAFSAQWWLKANTSVQQRSIRRSLFVHSETSNVGINDFKDTDLPMLRVQDRKSLMDALNNESFDLIYIASHADYDDGSQTGSIHLNENAAFTFHDILGLNFENSKVVLAACETHIGKESRSEGLMGFAYNFAWAGAKAVAGSLWKIPDQQSSQLLKSCAEGKGELSDVLADSRKNYLANQKGLNRHPYYWAGIVTFDSYPPDSTNVLLYYIVIVCILLIGILWTYIKK